MHQGTKALKLASRHIGPVTASAGLELGPVRRLSAQLKGKFKFEKGRSLELSALWSERTGAWVLSSVAQPHKAHKLTSTCVSHVSIYNVNSQICSTQ